MNSTIFLKTILLRHSRRYMKNRTARIRRQAAGVNFQREAFAEILTKVLHCKKRDLLMNRKRTL